MRPSSSRTRSTRRPAAERTIRTPPRGATVSRALQPAEAIGQRLHRRALACLQRAVEEGQVVVRTRQRMRQQLDRRGPAYYALTAVTLLMELDLWLFGALKSGSYCLVVEKPVEHEQANM